MTADPLAQTAATKLHNVSLDVLMEDLEEADRMIDAGKGIKDLVSAELMRRYLSQIEAGLAAAGKVTGSLTIKDGAYSITGTLGKRVSWDSEKLLAVMSTMTWDQAQRIFDIDVSVKEAKFNAIVDDALRAKLIDARTVKPLPPAIKLAKKEK